MLANGPIAVGAHAAAGARRRLCPDGDAGSPVSRVPHLLSQSRGEDVPARGRQPRQGRRDPDHPPEHGAAQSTSSGEAQAKANLGLMYIEDKGVPVDKQKAYNLLLDAINSGERSQVILVCHYQLLYHEGVSHFAKIGKE